MLKSRVHQAHAAQILFPHYKPFLSGTGHFSSHVRLRPILFRNQNNIRVRNFPSAAKAVATSTEQSTSVTAIVSVKVAVGGILSNLRLSLSRGLDDIAELLGKSILMELVSSELDPSKYFYL